jgi:hypothetical protein
MKEVFAFLWGLALNMKRIFIIIPFILFLISRANADITTGLQGWWKFDEGTGTSTTADSSSNGYNGTLHGSPSWITGKVGPYALQFNGTSQYVDIGNQPNLNFTTGSFSFSCWFKPISVNSPIFDKTAAASTSGYDIVAGISGVAGNVAGRIHNGAATAISNTWTGTNDGSWHQAIVVIDSVAQTIVLYGDGSAIGSPVALAGIGSVTTTASFQIGARAGASFFSGSVDDVRVYNRALTSSDALQLYQYPPPLVIIFNDYINKARLKKAMLGHS